MAVFCYLFDPSKCGGGDPRQYVVDWCNSHYIVATTKAKARGTLYEKNNWKKTQETLGEQIADIYDRYYNISYVQSGESDNFISNQIIDFAGYTLFFSFFRGLK